MALTCRYMVEVIADMETTMRRLEKELAEQTKKHGTVAMQYDPPPPPHVLAQQLQCLSLENALVVLCCRFCHVSCILLM